MDYVEAAAGIEQQCCEWRQVKEKIEKLQISARLMRKEMHFLEKDMNNMLEKTDEVKHEAKTLCAEVQEITYMDSLINYLKEQFQHILLAVHNW